jgi:hypothetical protein
MVLADPDSWDRYAAAHWLTIRRRLDANPDDELAPAFREELSTDPVAYVRQGREYLGWGVFALLKRSLQVEAGPVRLDAGGGDGVHVALA